MPWLCWIVYSSFDDASVFHALRDLLRVESDETYRSDFGREVIYSFVEKSLFFADPDAKLYSSSHVRMTTRNFFSASGVCAFKMSDQFDQRENSSMHSSIISRLW